MYGFFFSWEGETIRLPVNPAEVTIKIGSRNKTYDMVSLGEINIPRAGGLREISFICLLPRQIYPFVTTGGGFEEPIFYLNRFQRYKDSRKPVRFIMSRLLPDQTQTFETNLLVTIEDYSVTERAGESGEFYCTMNLKEYRTYGAKILIQQSSPTGEIKAVEQKERPSEKVVPKQYKVKAGDTLWAIAKKELNNGARYIEIAKLNHIQDPNKIAVGQVLSLPT